MSISTEETTVTRILEDFELPKKWNVIFYNDDHTSFEFVIKALVNIFQYDEFDAVEKAREIHELGKSIVGTYFYEIAEQRAAETVYNARTEGYPLKVEITQE
jgi:ATP-dependent Clp protease adaptor protein ClpS